MDGTLTNLSEYPHHTRWNDHPCRNNEHAQKSELVYSKLVLLLSKRRADYATYLSFHAKAVTMDYQDGTRACVGLENAIKDMLEEETRRAGEALGAAPRPTNTV